jgi:hypothetical protein
MTYTTRRRRTILQFLQIFFTEARTFIAISRDRLATAQIHSSELQVSAVRCGQKKSARSSVTFLPTAAAYGYNLMSGLPWPAVTAQVGLLHQALVLVRHQVRSDLRLKVHDHDHHDQERRAAEIERHVET